MPVDIKVARPFIFNSPAGRFELGIAVYPGMDDAFAADPWVVAHCEDAVVARGGTLFQFRTTISGLKPVPIFLGPVNAQWFTPTIEAGWEPLFRDDIDVNIEAPGIDDPNQPNPSGRDWAVGRHSSLMRDDANQLLATTKLFPGDASPPVSRAADPTPPVVLDSAGFPVNPANKAHMQRTLAIARMQQVGRARAAKEEVALLRLHAAGIQITRPRPQPEWVNSNERPPPTPVFDWSQHVYVEPPRTWGQPGANVAPPQGAGVPWSNLTPPDLPPPPRTDLASANERLRARHAA